MFLQLLRSSLVNNRTQAVVCADLGMVDYAIYPYSKVELKPKDKADLLEGMFSLFNYAKYCPFLLSLNFYRCTLKNVSFFIIKKNKPVIIK